MSVESTYKLLSAQQKSRNKKMQRTQDFSEILRGVKNFGELARNKAAEEFDKDARIREDKLKQNKALRDFSALEKTYMAGQSHLGGLGSYLMRENGEAYNIVQNQLNNDIEEGRVSSEDNLSKVRQNMMQELVNGRVFKAGDTIIKTDADGNDLEYVLKKGDKQVGTKEAGLLAAYENAYETGSKLMNAEDYTSYLQDRTSRPENVGGYLMSRLSGEYKNENDRKEDYIKRALATDGITVGDVTVSANEQIANRVAFNAANQAFKKGLGIETSSRIAQIVKENKQELSFRGDLDFVGFEEQEIEVPTGPDSSRKIKIKVPMFKHYRTGEITYDYPNKQATSDPLSKSLVSNGEAITTTTETKTVVDLYTGAEIETQQEVVYGVVNYGTPEQVIGKVTTGQTPTGSIVRTALTGAESVDDSLLEAQHDAYRYVLATYQDGQDQVSTKITEVLKTKYGEDAVQSDKSFKEFSTDAMRKSFIKSQNKIASQIGFKFPELSVEATRNLAATIAIEDLLYSGDKTNDQKDFSIGGVVSGISKDVDVNGVRVLSAIHKLVRNDSTTNLQSLFNAPLSKDEQGDFIGKLISPKELHKFNGTKLENGAIVPKNATTGGNQLRTEAEANEQAFKYILKTNDPSVRDETGRQGLIMSAIYEGSAELLNKKFDTKLKRDLSMNEYIAFHRDPINWEQKYYNRSVEKRRQTTPPVSDVTKITIPRSL